jgi:Icc-related predicted phosphoesterase
MKILCVSDQIDPIVYSTRMKERFSDIDLVLSAGDLPQEYIGFISSMLNKPVLYVAGNHDRKKRVAREGPPGFSPLELAPSDSGATDIGFKVTKESGFIVLGVPGSILYNGGDNQYSERAMAFRLALLAPRLLWNRLVHGRAADIILTHSPPKGIHDREDRCHRGFSSLLRLIRAAKPRWFVHGHVHLYDLSDVRVSRLGRTTIINAFSYWIIDTEGEKP